MKALPLLLLATVAVFSTMFATGTALIVRERRAANELPETVRATLCEDGDCIVEVYNNLYKLYKPILRFPAPLGSCDSRAACRKAAKDKCPGWIKPGSDTITKMADGSKECSAECKGGATVFLRCGP